MSTPTCSYKNCNRPVYFYDRFTNENKCIFHADRKNPQAFRDALAQQIRKWRNEKAKWWDFRGWVFEDVEREHSQSWESPYNLFRRAVFPVVATFDGATFLRDASFMGAKFRVYAGFVRTTFSKDASFLSAIFSGYGNFDGATFSGDAEFDGATFSEDAGFEGVIFSGDAGFSCATFEGTTWFTDVTFGGDARFTWATFLGDINLSYSSFTTFSIFDYCTMLGRIRLNWPGEGFKKDKKGKDIKWGKLLLSNLKFPNQKDILDLRQNAISEDAILRIEQCDMSHILLEGTDATRIEFYDPRWGKIGNRWAVGDEIHQPCKKRRLLQRALFMMKVRRRHKRNLRKRVAAPWRLIAQTYQQLTLRFRRDLDHPTANDFEQGLFEMRRRAALVGQGKWSDYPLYTIYRWLSYYSGKLWLPVLWLLLSIPLFATAYCWTNTRPRINLSWWNFLKSSLQIASLNRSGYEFAANNSIWVDVFIALQVICTATLVTLFVFAVRRRFKHGE